MDKAEIMSLCGIILILGILGCMIWAGQFDSCAANCPPGEVLIGTGGEGMICGPRVGK